MTVSELPRISVVVPSFNQGHFLSEALESIFRQDYPDLEVVVMDGGSTDDSVAIIKSYATRLKHWQSEKDGGQSAAINAGVRHCSGDLVAWLNSDDYYHGDALWTVGKAFAAHPGHGLYVGNGLRYDQSSAVYTPFCSRHIAFNRAALLQGTDYILQPSTFFLRKAWNDVQGLDRNLGFCMDWDIFLRIAKRYSVVAIQEFLGVSREYDETKTRSGKMKRAAEIIGMVQTHTGAEVTPGSLLFLLETLLDVFQDGSELDLSKPLEAARNVVARQIAIRYGGGHGFPEQNDPNDKVYLPLARAGLASRSVSTPPTRISVVVPSFNQQEYLRDSIESVLNQQHPHVETLVMEGGSADGSREWLEEHAQELVVRKSESYKGTVSAINEGLLNAQGEILAWLHPGDKLADGALREVSRAFAEDPGLDLVYGNAVHIDRRGEFYLDEHGTHLSGLWIGEFPAAPMGLTPNSMKEKRTPQPTVFFRRRLLERHGFLNESLPHTFDEELFARFARSATVKKLERTQALYRVRGGGVERWNNRLVERYEQDRRTWPSVFSPNFPRALQTFLASYLRRKFGGRPHRGLFWGAATIVALAAVTRLANPERWWKNRLHLRSRGLHPLFIPERTKGTLHSVFCSHRVPKDPPRIHDAFDLKILQTLGGLSSIELFAQEDLSAESSSGLLASLVNKIHTSKTIAEDRPDLIQLRAQRKPLISRFVNYLRGLGIPVLGPRFPLPITEQLPRIQAFGRPAIQETLERNRPDFLFVSNQANPLALSLRTDGMDTRLVLVIHEIEAERMDREARTSHGISRLAQIMETRRARVFERANLKCYDGALVRNERDRQTLIDEYGFPPERIAIFSKQPRRELSDYLQTLRRLPRRNKGMVRSGQPDEGKGIPAHSQAA